ncbi:uncharacterized protein LOC131649981 [Vicia villosa]|uniref:uncharacterized protein LOC131649981 n=1 Tax=Vicia villosa TaxID=3911 RepID=UPI00273CD2C1|nr:uncharacterized protein LOC131649981 [Vicia villosa]
MTSSETPSSQPPSQEDSSAQSFVQTNVRGKTVDALCCMGARYKLPTMHALRGNLLNKWVDDVKIQIEQYCSIWKDTSCTLMFVDASGASKTAYTLFKLFKEVVLYVGQENVVKIVTDNTVNYVVVGKLLEREFPKLLWPPCATHCGREILRPGPTRFATNFIALQSIMSHKDALRAMVKSKEWTTTTYFKYVKAKEFVEQVLDSRVWSKYADIVKITEPLVHVLRIVDSEDKPAMGYLYRVMYKAREEIEKGFRRNKLKIEPYLKILDRNVNLHLLTGIPVGIICSVL